MKRYALIVASSVAAFTFGWLVGFAILLLWIWTGFRNADY